MNTTCLVPPCRRELQKPPGLRTGFSDRKPSAAGRDFKALFCEFFRCAPEEYEQQIFTRFLHWHARPLTGLLSKLNPRFFSEDWGLIRDLANAVTHSEVLTELNRFYGRNLRERNWVRRRLSLRLSGKRILRLSRALFGAQKPS